MRRGNDNAFVGIDGDTFVGINLGADFTAEHERGIIKLKRQFGIEGVKNGLISKRIGIDARRVTLLPSHFHLIEKHGFTYLVSTSTHVFTKDMSKKNLDRMIGAYWTSYDKNAKEIVLQTAWDEKSFGIAAKGADGKKYLKLLFDAFNNNDAIITFGHDGNPFSNSGLMLLIASKLPQKYIDSQAAADMDKINLDKAAKKTGIIDRIANSDRQYFACSPRWANDGKTEVIFWLNPREQHKYNSGWMSVADLDGWIAGKGKVIKQTA